MGNKYNRAKKVQYQRFSLGQQECEYSREKGMCTGLLERSCILTMIFKKKSTIEETIFDAGAIRVHRNFPKFDIILNTFNR